MSNIPPSFSDLRASDNGNQFGRLWNKLLERLDAQRIVLRSGLTEENAGNYRAVGVAVGSGGGGGGGGGWNGVVIFDSQRGKRVTTVAGILTDFLRIHVSDASAGLLEYSDGSDLEAWPDGCIVRKISGIVGDLYVG